MDKHKLANIIIKDLEEIRILSEEIAGGQDDSSLIIELALNRARLLVQEIELLRELAGNSVSLPEETGENSFEEEDEVSAISFSDPELEILNFEEGDVPETEELPGEAEIEDEEEDLDEDDLEEDEDEPESADEELEEVVSPEKAQEPKEETEPEKEVSPQKPIIQQTELKNGPQPGVREIHVDDLDEDEDVEPVHFTSTTGTTVKPPMREIPKPENTAPEKTVVGETFQKERSLNETIGENRPEPKLTSAPIPSLRAAIGLNDRIIFIREIFNNNTEKYNTVIEKLDRMEYIQEAVEFLKANLSMQKNEASIKFVDLLKRRFTK